jgi:phospholipid-binding lipoprotein MlaA
MSFLVLTVAVAVANTPVPGGGPPATVAATDLRPGALEQAQPMVESVELLQTDAPAQSTDSSPPNEPASSAQSEPQTSTPVAAPGEIIVTGRKASPDDPLEDLNSAAYNVTQTVDETFVAPVAFAYKEIMPRPIRKGLRNFLNNLNEPIVFLNFMLQLKPGKAFETVGRFAINSTLGAAGLVDMAKRKPFNLPRRRNGFANTLGFYGVKPGPYFYLPLIGSTTLRDFIGNRIDLFILPFALGRKFNRPEYMIPIGVLGELDHRIEFDDQLREIRATQDPYVAARKYYLQKRQAEIDALRGRGNSTIKAREPGPAATDNLPTAATPAPERKRLPNPSLFGL